MTTRTRKIVKTVKSTRCFCRPGITCTCGDCNTPHVHVTPAVWKALKRLMAAKGLAAFDKATNDVIDAMAGIYRRPDRPGKPKPEPRTVFISPVNLVKVDCNQDGGEFGKMAKVPVWDSRQFLDQVEFTEVLK
jgi:hypothetical protein